MHPYRQPATDREARSAPSEEPILYMGLCVIGAIPIAIALLRGSGFGVEATVGLGMALAGLAGLVASRRTAGRGRADPHSTVGRGVRAADGRSDVISWS